MVIISSRCNIIFRAWMRTLLTLITHAGGPFVIDAMVTRASMLGRRRDELAAFYRRDERVDRSQKEPSRPDSRKRRRQQYCDKIGADIIRSLILPAVLMKGCSSIENFQSIINDMLRRHIMTRMSSCVKR